MKFLNEIDGASRLITDSQNRLVTDTKIAEWDANTTNRHTHNNKAVIDKFTEVDNKPYYNGKEIGGGTSAIIKSEEIISTEGQTVFTLTKGTYTPNENKLAIYIWGVKQHSNAFIETSTTSFTLSSGLKEGDRVIAEWFETSPSIKGDKGEQGEQGIQGEPGDIGLKGDTGARGFQGNAGEDGANGSVTSYDEDTKTLIISNGTATGGGVSNPKTFALIDDIILLEDTQLVSITPSIACDHYYLKFIPYGTTKNTGSVTVYFYYAKVSGKSNLGVRLNPFTQNTPALAWSFSLVELWKYNDSIHAFQMAQTSNDPTPETTTSPTAVMSWPITGKQYHTNAEFATSFVLQCWGQYMGAGTRIVLYGEVDANV